MSTTVRIRPEDKARLDRLQARYLLKHGRRLSLDAALGKIIEVASRHEDEVLGQDVAPKFSARQKKQILALGHDLGHETREETIDEELYGARLR